MLTIDQSWFTIRYAPGSLGTLAVFAPSGVEAIQRLRVLHHLSIAWTHNLQLLDREYQVLDQNAEEPTDIPSMTVPELLAALMGEKAMSVPEALATLTEAGIVLRTSSPATYMIVMLTAATVRPDPSGRRPMDQDGRPLKVHLFTCVQPNVFRVSTRADVASQLGLLTH